MALAIIAAVVEGNEFRWIELKGTDTARAGEPDHENDYEVLEAVRLGFEDNGYASEPTLAIMSPVKVVESEREIGHRHTLRSNDLGVDWQPREPGASAGPAKVSVAANWGTVTLAASTMNLTEEELGLMRQLALEDPDDKGIPASDARAQAIHWIVRYGVAQMIVDGEEVTYRLTPAGRRLALSKSPAG
jgi:hypothetical protein